MYRLILLLLWLLLSSAVTAQQTLTVGILKDRPQAIMETRWQPLADYLQEQFPEFNISLSILSVTKLNTAIERNQLDFVLTDPSHYIYLREKFPLSGLMVTLSESIQGKEINALGGVIFCDSGRSDINSLNDLKGKRVAAADTASLAGFQAQYFALKQAGITLADLSEITHFNGAQDNIVDAVLQGRADIGFVRSGLLEEMARQGLVNKSQIKVLNPQKLYGFPVAVSTRLYPDWPFLALHYVDLHIAHRFAVALMTLNINSPELLQRMNISGFSIAENYASVEQLMRDLQLEPFDHFPQKISWQEIWDNYRNRIFIVALTLFIIFSLILKLIWEQRKLRYSLKMLAQQKYALDQHAIVAITDVNGNITYSNEKFSQVSGYSSGELLGKNHRLMNSGYHDTAFFRNMYSSISQGITWHGVICNKAKDGRLFWLDTTIVPFTDSNGKPENYLVVRTDITRQKETEKELVESESRLSLLLNTLPYGVQESDTQGVISYGNIAMHKILDLPPASISGHYVWDFQPDAEKKEELRNYIALLIAQQPEPEPYVTRNITVDNREIIIEIIWDYQRNTSGEVTGFISVISDITERQKVESTMYENEEKLIEAQSVAKLGHYSLNLITGFWNSSAQIDAILGIDEHYKKDIEGWMKLVHKDFRPELDDFLHDDLLRQHKDLDKEYKIIALDSGQEKWIHDVGKLRFDDAQNPVEMFGTIQDITELKQTEQKLRRAQKMDAVGHLTGGIAHDFNNILGIILGNVTLLERHINDRNKALKRIEIIKQSAQRAVDLTRQLLGFSSRQAASMAITDINQVIDAMDSLITHSITSEIAFRKEFEQQLWLCKIDPGDLEDVLINLVVNAKDAMLGGGELLIRTSNVYIDQDFCVKNPGATVGEFVQLSIIDNGEGIPAEIQENIFEPFFTSKSQGKGTGLGLAMVYGFVKRSNGYIRVTSQEQNGSRFDLYFPRTMGEKQIFTMASETQKELPGDNETILVVDDEEGLLELASESLQLSGYKVLTAGDANQALQRLAENSHVNLLFSDVIMPGGMNGYELAKKAVEKYPGLKVLLTSGYDQSVVPATNDTHLSRNLLNKPYTQSKLTVKIRELLGDQLTADTDNSNGKNYSQIHWSEEFNIGIEAVDNDHRVLLGLFNDIGRAFSNNDNKALAETLNRLYDFAVEHFKREEAIMEICHYPRLMNHRNVHHLFLKQIKNLCQQQQSGVLDEADIQQFLQELIFDHVNNMDSNFASYCQGKEKIITQAMQTLNGEKH